MDLRELPEGPARRHPWEVARARFFAQVARAHVASQAPLRVVDVGAGDGYLAGVLLSRLPPGSACVCVDPHYSDAQLEAFGSGSPGKVAFARQPPPGPCDLLLLLDVLEHVEDDTGLLCGLVDKHLESGGHALVSVPAFQALYVRRDVFLGHHRRYRWAPLRALARAAGLEIVRRGGLFHGGLPLRAAQKLGELLRGVKAAPETAAELPGGTEIGSWSHGALLSGVLGLGLAADNAVSRLLAGSPLLLPGLSLWLLGRKR